MSPRTAVQNEEIRAIAKAKILQAALELFATRGYSTTTVDAIAESAGVSTGLLYYHFENKPALLQAIFEQSLSDVHATFAAADREPDPAHRLPALLRAAGTIVPRHRNFWAVWYGLRMQSEVLRSLGPSVMQFSAAIVRTLEGYLRDINWPEPGVEAQLLFAQIDGMCQHYVLDPSHYPLEPMIERLVERYMKGEAR
ncbi:MAG TPA: TetR/AcrR family transcriptional regulator [Vicinamibacterales bacterium]|nr:TetR/AcrR family transcriptional regulator [Vicinamibacterales bacterium]